ncbi:hypothetical protein COJ46_02450 [Bacillus sp. AFS077874]|uniref:hypothetical protein n=1 Tax=Bacillus sp. AFS077874 TaxID=2033513 RepID=UPI000BF8B4B2|nr:hypothetical protein [Bacillus sp. AFS077874]PFM82690.1 hypothetical protein COJ46_02450 [Bacillus sp. AFS077874]
MKREFVKHILEEIKRTMDETYDSLDYKTKNHYHTLLQRNLVKLAKSFNFEGMKEYQVIDVKHMNYRNGFIDVVWFLESKPVVTIEVESGIRIKSVYKLCSVDADLKIYLYYGKKEKDAFRELNETFLSENNILFFKNTKKLMKNADFGIKKEHYSIEE